MDKNMKNVIAIAKALSDGHRIRTLFALRKGELCVCRIITLLGLAPSTVSKHMTVLKNAGLVESRKEERWIYYRLPASNDKTETIQDALEWVFCSVSEDGTIFGDSKELIKILRQTPESLCKKRCAQFMKRKKHKVVRK
jgi:ArsR family transcriptional regulator, arsenate/arsenite/antimonite-responsive transcriptional repressor